MLVTSSHLSILMRFRSAPVLALHITACNKQVTCPVSPVEAYSRVYLVCMTVLSVLFIQARILHYLISM